MVFVSRALTEKEPDTVTNTIETGTTLTVNGLTFTVGQNFDGMSEWNRRRLARMVAAMNLEVVGAAQWTRVQAVVDHFAQFA